MPLYKTNASLDVNESHGRKIKADQSNSSCKRQSAVMVRGEWVQVNKIRFRREHRVAWERVEHWERVGYFFSKMYWQLSKNERKAAHCRLNDCLETFHNAPAMHPMWTDMHVEDNITSICLRGNSYTADDGDLRFQEWHMEELWRFEQSGMFAGWLRF